MNNQKVKFRSKIINFNSVIVLMSVILAAFNIKLPAELEASEAIALFGVIILVIFCVPPFQGATQQIKSNDPIVLAKASYYYASLWYNNTLEIYLRYRPGITSNRAQELNKLFRECNKVFDNW